jgi:hypothetical protein
MLRTIKTPTSATRFARHDADRAATACDVDTAVTAAAIDWKR